MGRILIGVLAVVAAAVVALGAVLMLAPSAPENRPALVEVPPLQAATRTSYVIAPTAVSLTAIRDVMDAQAPRDLSGKRDNPVGQLLQNAELGWTMSRDATGEWAS